jgi:hypothetical protein
VMRGKEDEGKWKGGGGLRLHFRGIRIGELRLGGFERLGRRRLGYVGSSLYQSHFLDLITYIQQKGNIP